MISVCFSGVYYDPLLAAHAANDSNYRLQVCRMFTLFDETSKQECLDPAPYEMPHYSATFPHSLSPSQLVAVWPYEMPH